jgi:integrase
VIDPVRYAVDVEMIDHAPKIDLLKSERPEIVCWEIEEYARLLEASNMAGAGWYAAACLAGEAGLRVGEVKALRWRKDVDLVAGTITINQQVRHKLMGTPKGRTRRTVPMTPRLLAALKALQVVRTGYVTRNLDSLLLSDSQARDAMYRICRLAGFPERGWHVLRHSFGMLYFNFAAAHAWPVPLGVIQAAGTEVDPDRRILLMLGARGNCVATSAVEAEKEEERQSVR